MLICLIRWNQEFQGGGGYFPSAARPITTPPSLSLPFSLPVCCYLFPAPKYSWMLSQILGVLLKTSEER